MRAALHLFWDLDDLAATCTVDDLEAGVHTAGLDRFTGLDGLHLKVWFRDGTRYGSLMVFEDAAARDAVLPWVTDRIRDLSGLDPVRVECFDVIAIAEGAAGADGLAQAPADADAGAS